MRKKGVDVDGAFSCKRERVLYAMEWGENEINMYSASDKHMNNVGTSLLNTVIGCN